MIWHAEEVRMEICFYHVTNAYCHNFAEEVVEDGELQGGSAIGGWVILDSGPGLLDAMNLCQAVGLTAGFFEHFPVSGRRTAQQVY